VNLQNIIPQPIKELMEKAFIDYAMSVITDRALPDIRDGLKPVHRRILFAMHEAGNYHNKAYKKSARMVGDVIGKYHPHGDTSVYDAAVRMAQFFSMNELLIDGQGNFGSVDGDNPAAMRYTEMRLTKLAAEMFGDLDKETLAWHENYDGSEKEPEVLTAPYPNLLVNGTEGIAVGMATSIPPHNLVSVIDATLALIANPAADHTIIRSILQAPDFPTGAIVHGLDGFAEAVETGKGRVKLRAVWHEEERGRGAKSLIIDELPYQVNKAKLVIKIAELVRDKEVEGITNLRDESDTNMRVVIELRKDEDPGVMFSTLCAKTELEISFNYNCVVLDHGIPKQLGLKDILLKWIDFRLDVVLKRFIFDRKQSLAKLHLLAGYMAAMGMLDEVIKTIRAASNAAEAKPALMKLINVDEIQADAILALRLQKLTGMELDGIRAEHAEVFLKVQQLTDVIESRELLVAVVCEELEDIKSRYGHTRRTEIGHGLSALTREDMIPREEVVIVLTRNGYIKRLPTSSLNAQNRGTRGKRSISVGEGDEISAIYQSNTHDTILVFDEEGRVYARKGYEIPECSLTSQGRHIANVIVGFDKKLASILRIPVDVTDASVVIVTRNGLVKRSLVEEYMSSRISNSGALGITILPDDGIFKAFVAVPGQHMMIVASNGKTIRFDLSEVREIGRTGQGVRGISLEFGHRVVGAHVIDADSTEHIVCIGEKGVGKRTAVADFRAQGRGGQGVNGFKITAKTGNLVAALGADESKDIVMLSSNGVSNRIAVSDIRDAGKATSGVILMNLDEGQTLVAVTTIVRAEPEPESEATLESAISEAGVDLAPSTVVAEEINEGEKE
jgi:DNA gyrase subunit A